MMSNSKIPGPFLLIKIVNPMKKPRTKTSQDLLKNKWVEPRTKRSSHQFQETIMKKSSKKSQWKANYHSQIFKSKLFSKIRKFGNGNANYIKKYFLDKYITERRTYRNNGFYSVLKKWLYLMQKTPKDNKNR